MTRCMPGTFPRPWESRNNSGTMMTRLSTGLRVIAAIPIARPQISVRYSQAPSAACSVPGAAGPRAERAEDSPGCEERRGQGKDGGACGGQQPRGDLRGVEQAPARHHGQRRHDHLGGVLAGGDRHAEHHQGDLPDAEAVEAGEQRVPVLALLGGQPREARAQGEADDAAKTNANQRRKQQRPGRRPDGTDLGQFGGDRVPEPVHGPTLPQFDRLYAAAERRDCLGRGDRGPMSGVIPEDHFGRLPADDDCGVPAAEA